MNVGAVGNNLMSSVNKAGTSINQDFSFKDIINNEMEKLNHKQVEADKMTQDFIMGRVDDLHTVMIATEEARLSLELAVQVRNKVVEAYKEINNMQL